MSIIGKTLVIGSLTAAVGFGVVIGMQRTTVAAIENIERGYRQLFVAQPSLVTPDAASVWLAENKAALEQVEARRLLRKAELWLAAPGARGDLRELNDGFEKMIDIRRKQLASVEKRLTDSKIAGDDWIALLPKEMRSQIANVNRTLAWLKEDSRSHAALDAQSESFTEKAQALHEKASGYWGGGVTSPLVAPADAEKPAPAAQPVAPATTSGPAPSSAGNSGQVTARTMRAGV